MSENHRILVIDDNEAIHSDFRKVIGPPSARSGALDRAARDLFDEEPLVAAVTRSYDIDSAYQGQEGLALVRQACDQQRRYALAFVDVRMPPGWDGIETAQQLWRADPDLQIVLCTAYSDYSWNDMVLKLGETDRLLVVKKPFDNIEVRQIACALTTKWQLTQQVRLHMSLLSTTVEARTADLAEANRLLRIEIDERRKALEILKETEARSRGILETVADAIVTLDEFAIVETFNRAAEEMFGYRAAEIIGQSVLDLIPCADRQHHAEIFSRYRNTGQATSIAGRQELPGLRKDGTVFPLEITVCEGRAANHRWFTSIARDLTRQKQIEAQMLQSQKMEAIGHLAAGVAHEINTPIQYVGDNLYFMQDAFDQLNRVCTTCESLLDDLASGQLSDERLAAAEAQIKNGEMDFLRAEIPQALEHSREGVARVAKIVSAMRDFSHPGSEQKVLADINRAIENTITIASNEWKYIADLVTDLDPRLSAIACLPNELNQMFLNLIVNAAHSIAEVADNHPGQKGKIVVSTRQDDDFVEIRVSDSGTGIPETIRAKIFDPFFTTKEVGRGTGQGLAIAHSVVCDKHGGSITFETSEGHGTTFIVRLPVAAAAGTNTVAASADEVSAPSLAHAEPQPAR